PHNAKGSDCSRRRIAPRVERITSRATQKSVEEPSCSMGPLRSCLIRGTDAWNSWVDQPSSTQRVSASCRKDDRLHETRKVLCLRNLFGSGTWRVRRLGGTGWLFFGLPAAF